MKHLIHHASKPVVSMEMSAAASGLLELVRRDDVTSVAALQGTTRLHMFTETGGTLLHSAVAAKAHSVLQFLLQDGAIPVDTQDSNGDTPLHLAVQSGCAQAVNLLLAGGADDTITNNRQDPPLHLLIRREGSSELLQAFLSHCVDLLVRGARGYTALHVTAEGDRIEALEILWPHLSTRHSLSELKVYTRDSAGKTPLHIAAHSGSHQVLSFLLSKALEGGASSDNVLHLMDEGHHTPLHTAVQHGHKNVVDTLLKFGASPTVLRGETPPPLHLACAQSKTDIVREMVSVCGREILLSLDAHGATPLHRCAKSVSDELFSFVIERGSDVNCQDDTGATPLHIAAMQGGAWRVEFLISNEADPFILNKQGHNPFHLSLIHRREESFGVLTQSEHARVLSETPTTGGDLPIHLAVRHKASQFVPLLLSLMGASDCSKALEFTDHHGNNVLHAAAQHGDVGSVEYILSVPCARYLLNSVNSLGLTPLHLAARSGMAASVRTLLDHGAIANKCHHGDTPFMLACLSGHLETAALLLDSSSVNVGAANREGESALHLAARSKNSDVVLLCLDREVPITLNKSSESFFDIVLEGGSVETITAVLRHARWQECLDVSSPHLPHPVLRIIEMAPEAFQVVLDRSVSHSPRPPEDREYWVEYDFKYLTLDYTQPARDPAPSVPSNADSVSSLNLLPEITVPDETPPTNVATPRRKLPHSFAVLAHLIKFRHQQFLVHPLITTFLDQKWNRYARFYYIFRYLLFFFFALFLSVFILATPPPPQFPSPCNLTADDGEPVDTEEVGVASVVLRFVTLFIALPNLLVWLLDLYILGLTALRHFFLELELWIHGLTVLLTLVFLVPWEGLGVVYWGLGAVAVFLAWIKVVLALQPFSMVGIIVTMLINVTRKVFSVLLVTILVLCAFALPLYILLATVPDFTYSNFGTALFSVLASLHAELDYRNFVLLELSSQLGYSVLTFLFLCLATIIMPIVVINLLIGLAVGDIARIQQEAVLSQRGVEVRALTALDSRLPDSWLNQLSQQSCKRYPNKSCTDKVARVVRGLWSEFDEPTPTTERSEERKNELIPRGYLKKLVELEESIAHIELEQVHQQESLRRIEGMLKSLLDQR